MDPSKAAERTSDRRRLIPRPRLERLLDESEARIAVLSAPAGYGKTTLARQWLAARTGPAVWFQARPASSDVGALASGIRQGFAEAMDGIDDRVSKRLRRTADADREVQELAELLAHDVASCPPDTTLVIDDYQHIAERASAEGLIADFVDLTRISILISTRVRPSWISAKHLLYGEFLELGRNALAMTHEEAKAVLDPGTDERRLLGLVALTEGWPAVIGLAALLPDPIELSIEAVPEALHEYFADELYQGMPEELQWHLVQLSVATLLPKGLTKELVDNGQILEEGYSRGFLTKQDRDYYIHPLLRQFLRGKFDEFSREAIRETAETTGRWYLQNEYWDEAFTLASEFALADVLVELVERGMDSILSEGRMSTLDQWLEGARRSRPGHPAVRLAEIESAFRRGRWRDAESRALRMADDLSEGHRLGARVLFRAGQIAQLDDRQDEALELLTRAIQRARDPIDVSRTMWSRFVTLCDLEEPGLAWEALNEFEQLPPTTVEDLVRARHGRLLWAVRWGGITEELERQEDALDLVAQVPDPLVRTGFLQSLGSALGLATRYGEALQVADRELLEADISRLEWVKPHGLELKGLAESGLRKFRSALSALGQANSLAAAQGNLHSQMSSVALTARIFMARGEHERALKLVVTDWERRASSGMEGDYLATKALVLACCRKPLEAMRFLEASNKVSDQIDGRVLRMLVKAVVAHQQRDREAETLVAKAIREARLTGNLDALVCAYRAYPELLKILQGLDEPERHAVQRLVWEVDSQLAQRAGFPRFAGAPRKPSERLTPREQEVFDLLRQGMTNRQIARSMWIEETTVKVHVRHILRKLAARSRTEAAAIGVERVSPQPAEQAD